VDEPILVEEIWVNVQQGAEKTGRHIDHIRRLARESWRLPEDQRPIRIRKDGHPYLIWLPDLVNYVEKRIPVTMQKLDLSDVEKTWVSATEAAEITGYNRDYLSKLAGDMSRKPEGEREIRTKKRPHGMEMWLPDLVAYTHKVGRGSKKRFPKIS
jgi:hypothetical protein